MLPFFKHHQACYAFSCLILFMIAVPFANAHHRSSNRARTASETSNGCKDPIRYNGIADNGTEYFYCGYGTKYQHLMAVPQSNHAAHTLVARATRDAVRGGTLPNTREARASFKSKKVTPGEEQNLIAELDRQTINGVAWTPNTFTAEILTPRLTGKKMLGKKPMGKRPMMKKPM